MQITVIRNEGRSCHTPNKTLDQLKTSCLKKYHYVLSWSRNEKKKKLPYCLTEKEGPVCQAAQMAK